MKPDEPNDEPKTCWDCNYLLPASSGRFTEFGICLREPAFEPHIEDLIDRQDYSKCKELVKKRKFRADRPACPNLDLIDESPFEGAEVDDDGSPRITHQVAALDEFRDADIGLYLTGINSPDLQVREQAFRTLSFLASVGNDRAVEFVITYFESLPPPTTVPDAHYKLRVFRDVKMVEALRPRIQRVLIEELCRVESNQTTRGWITEILRFFEMAEDEDRKALSEVLKRRQFSIKLRRRIEDILEGPQEREWW